MSIYDLVEQKVATHASIRALKLMRSRALLTAVRLVGLELWGNLGTWSIPSSLSTVTT
jgi:hypothetical protein